MKKIKCPHCGTLLIEGEALCCEALKTELNQLAEGKSIAELTAAFNKWYEDHKVVTQ